MKIRRYTALTLGITTAAAIALTGCASEPASATQAPVTQKPAAQEPTAQEPAVEETKMITNEGHKLAFHVTPGEEPAIVLDAGGGLDSSSWDTIAPTLSEQTGA